MTKVARGTLGLVFIGIGAFCALFAWEESGFESWDWHGWLIAFGAPMFGFTGVLVARTGDHPGWPLGVALAIAAIIVTAFAARFDHGNRSVVDFAGCIGAAFVLGVASVVALARKRA